MYTDLFGKKRLKINLHTHTSLSDGHKTPEEVCRIYRNAGYDAIALTDHWKVGPESTFEGMTVLSGVEYNTPGCNCSKNLFHILGIGMAAAPKELTRQCTAQGIIDAIRAVDGLVVLAHPAWSLNTPEMILPLEGVEATEIFNTISGVHMSRRADSSLIVDMLACRGRIYPLLAADDTHYYDSDGPVSWIMAEADDNSQEAILSAVREGRFYATQGPELHILREDDHIVVQSSPCREIVVHSNMGWAPRVFIGDGICEARYKIYDADKFVRAEAVDAYGRRAWTNILPLACPDGAGK
jgi:hypothetical protein